ncbi:MAG: energy transducer TonB [Pseudomonadota bacterium]|nr:energy transducer TonB [Pseudomonadota bacterium]
MYRPVTTKRDRVATIAAVVLIHAALAYAFLNLSGTLRAIEDQAALQMFDLSETPPPPPIVEIPPEPEQAQPEEDEGAASPPNIKSVATPVVAPKPRIALPVPVPIVVTETPNIGNEATQGAAPVPGPGTGAGGTGTGTGSGGSGSGTGGGGSGGTETRPSIVESTKLTLRDYPPGAGRAWPRGGRVFVAVRVQVDGRATDCKVNRSSGNRAIDADTCRLVEARVRFTPARDAEGRPYVDWYGYVQAPVNF